MPQRGRGSFSLSSIGNFIRDKKLISQGLGLIPHPAGQVASQVASMLGLGKRKRRKRVIRRVRPAMVGRGIFSDLGGGIGNVFGGLGGGLGGAFHGLFGSGRKRKRVNKIMH